MTMTTTTAATATTTTAATMTTDGVTRSNCPCGGLYVVEGEVGLLMTAMRRGVRWSSHSHQDEDQDVLMKGLATLKEALNETKNLSQLEPGVFMSPFLEIIRSEETTGAVTSLALSAVNKIISYGLIDVEHPAIASCVEAIADAVTHARFVGTDASGDGVVLMRILQVLRALVLSHPGDNLSNESICEIMLSCFRICFETRLSELLRRTAEHCLRDMVQHLFVRLPQFADDTRGLLNMKKMRTGNLENTRSKSKKNKVNLKPKTKSNFDEMDDVETQLLSPIERVKVNHLATTPISPVGNIVDMQGSLNQVTSDKVEDDKSDNKASVLKTDFSKNNNKDSTESSHKESSKESNLPGKSDVIKSSSENKVESQSLNLESKQSESQTENNELSTPMDTSIKQNIPGCQDNQINSDEKSNFVQSPMGSVEDLSVDESSNINNVKASNLKVESESMEEYVNSQGVRFMPLQQHTPYGSLCVRELFRFLVSLCSPLDKQNTEIMMHLGLSLLQVTLEVAADALSNFPSLLVLAKDDLTRNLILLLGTERLSILAANLQVSFLLFESQREHLKFQMEQFIVKLMELVNSDSSRISYEQRELALEAIVRLWKIPGLSAELFINYDCGLFSINLYEELMKMLSKVLFNNVSALIGNMYSMQFISLDAIFSLIAGIEARCKDFTDILKPSRHSALGNLPSREELLEIKTKKRWLAIGSEKFNENPREGICKLSEHGLLGGTPGHPDPDEIAKLLRENPTLDKKAIGEYLSKKENTNILHSFVHSFNLHKTRIDQAVRQYMETFRLPGEAPLISLLLEKFAEHWHESNNRPFASADAAFTLAYAIIMLNVDQHNHNVKRQSNPMTAEEFKKNLKKINGGADFDQYMLDEIYTAVKSEEIIMPAEQTGLVKENYLWKCLLRRGTSPESVYVRVGDSSEFIDKDLAERAWAPIISALCRAYDKAPDRTLQRRVVQTFLSCAAISAHYSMTSDLDTLIVSLCKFTGLVAGGQPDQIVLKLGGSGTCQLATRTLFKICHLYGDALRASWKNIIDCLQTLFKAKLLPKNLTEGEDFLDPSGKVSLIRESTIPKAPPAEQGLLSSLYSYIASDTSRTLLPIVTMAKKRAVECVAHCYLKQIIEESKFLQVDSLRSLVTALVSASASDEGAAVFLLELLLDTTIQNRDRVGCIWPVVQAQLDGLLTSAARDNQPHLLERATVGMLRLAVRLLRGEEFARTVLAPLAPLAQLPSAATPPLSRQVAYGLAELLETGAANIHGTEDWRVVFSLLECAGAGALQPKQPVGAVLDEGVVRGSPVLVMDQRPSSPVPEWVLVSPTGTEAPLPVAADTIVLDRELQPHDPAALVKCCESLTFLVRDVAHVTPFNFELCVRCVRTFAEAVLCSTGKRTRVHNVAEEPPGYQQTPLQLLDLMHTLHTKTAQVFRWWAEEDGATSRNGNGNGNGAVAPTTSLWPQAWRPLLQGIARLCCDSRRPVRAAAITFLQSTLLAHDLGQLSAVEWSQCLEQVLFPLLAQLLSPIAANDPLAVEETRVRAAMLLSKVFLHHLNPLLTLPGFLPLWLTVLDLLRAYMHADNSENLYEAIPESLKNMLLVMASAGVLQAESYLWTPTWRAIDTFLPNLKNELFPERTISAEQQQQPADVYPKPVSPWSEDQLQTRQQDDFVTSVEIVPPSIVPDVNEQPQQVISRVGQLLSSVSSSVAIQPMASAGAPQSTSYLWAPTWRAIDTFLPNIKNELLTERTSPVEQQQQQQPADVYPKPVSPWSEDQLPTRQQDDFVTSVEIVPPSVVPDVKDDSRPQQVISLIGQPSPSVSNPVPIQPVAPIYAPLPRDLHPDQHQHQQHQHHQYQQLPPHYQTLGIRDPGSPAKHQYAHMPQMQDFQTGVYAETLKHAVEYENQPEIPAGDTAMIFNSAAYFTEDPAADRLFIVTNP